MIGCATTTPMKAGSWRRTIVSRYATASTFDQKRLIGSRASSSCLDGAKGDRDQDDAREREDRDLGQDRDRAGGADVDRAADGDVVGRREDVRDPADDERHVAHREREA